MPRIPTMTAQALPGTLQVRPPGSQLAGFGEQVREAGQQLFQIDQELQAQQEVRAIGSAVL